MLRFNLIICICFFKLAPAAAQSGSDSLPKYDYQIYLPKPAKEIKQLLYEKDCTPINGNISDTKKAIIMQGYEHGNKVHVIVVYTDGTEDEFVRSPCFIDPVIL